MLTIYNSKVINLLCNILLCVYIQAISVRPEWSSILYLESVLNEEMRQLIINRAEQYANTENRGSKQNLKLNIFSLLGKYLKKQYALDNRVFCLIYAMMFITLIGWSTRRHAHYPTTDLEINSIFVINIHYKKLISFL